MPEPKVLTAESLRQAQEAHRRRRDALMAQRCREIVQARQERR